MPDGSLRTGVEDALPGPLGHVERVAQVARDVPAADGIGLRERKDPQYGEGEADERRGVRRRLDHENGHDDEPHDAEHQQRPRTAAVIDGCEGEPSTNEAEKDAEKRGCALLAPGQESEAGDGDDDADTEHSPVHNVLPLLNRDGLPTKQLNPILHKKANHFSVFSQR